MSHKASTLWVIANRGHSQTGNSLQKAMLRYTWLCMRSDYVVKNRETTTYMLVKEGG